MKSDKKPSRDIPSPQHFLEEEEIIQIEKRAKWDREQAKKNNARRPKHDSANGSTTSTDE